MKYIQKYSSILLVALAATFVLALPASAVNVVDDSCSAAGADSSLCSASGDDLFGAGGIWSNIINALLFVIGAVAVLMIIIGAFSYVTGGGDPNALTSAKNTIQYAAIGLVLALAAGGIINFVLERFA